MEISFIIPSFTDKIKTMSSLESCSFPYEVIISSKYGLGYARNYGAKQAKNELLVFVDSDLELSPEIWKYICSVGSKELGLTFLDGLPCSRVFVIHQKDFWRLGGFDESLVFQGEDRDFFVRAIDFGYKYSVIPYDLIHHIEHPKRYNNIFVAIGCVKEEVILQKKHWGRHRQIFAIKYLDRLKKFHVRSALLAMLFMFYYFVLRR